MFFQNFLQTSSHRDEYHETLVNIITITGNNVNKR